MILPHTFWNHVDPQPHTRASVSLLVDIARVIADDGRVAE